MTLGKNDKGDLLQTRVEKRLYRLSVTYYPITKVPRELHHSLHHSIDFLSDAFCRFFDKKIHTGVKKCNVLFLNFFLTPYKSDKIRDVKSEFYSLAKTSRFSQFYCILQLYNSLKSYKQIRVLTMFAATPNKSRI